MEISLTIEEAELLLEAAVDNQSVLLSHIKRMEKLDTESSREHVLNARSKYMRCENAILSLSKKLTFPS
jgi:hypothetical protein